MTDQELISQFESCTLAEKDFSHANHVRVAFLYLQQLPLPDAIAKFSGRIRALAARYGKADRYHETITQAYIFIIHERMTQRSVSNWQDFAALNKDLLHNGKIVLERYYRPETIASDSARTSFVAPDRAMLIQ